MLSPLSRLREKRDRLKSSMFESELFKCNVHVVVVVVVTTVVVAIPIAVIITTIII